MRLQRIELNNMRSIGASDWTIDFPADKNVTILLGDNGCGKTTILDSIAFMVSPFIAQFPGSSDKKFSDYDVHRNNNGLLAPFLEISALFTTDGGVPIGIIRTRKGSEAAPASDLSQIKDYANYLKEKVSEHDSATRFPVFAYYGTGRGQITAPERKRNFQKVFERWDCYRNALEPSTDFKSFFAWFDLMEDEERRERENRRDFDYKLPALEAVRNALSDFVGSRFSTPKIELHPLRFEMTEGQRKLRIEQMSDGYKIVIAMVADIASRMAEANPDAPNPLLSSGIILIDEIDLHLHPKWQRKIVGQLAKTFPNVQFILTTHSPVIVSGASEFARILQLPEEGGYDSEKCTLRNLSTLDIGQLLLSDLFGLPSLMTPQWEKLIRNYEELLAKPELSTDEKERAEAMKRKLSLLSAGNSPTDFKIAALLEKIAAELGIKI